MDTYRVVIIWKDKFKDNLEVFNNIKEYSPCESAKLLFMLNDCGESVFINLDCVSMYIVKKMGEGKVKSK